MLSFKLLSSVGDSELQMLKTGLSLTEQEELMYALPQLEAEDDTEYAVAVMYGCLLVRIFDMGRYLFLFPLLTYGYLHNRNSWNSGFIGICCE